MDAWIRLTRFLFPISVLQWPNVQVAWFLRYRVSKSESDNGNLGTSGHQSRMPMVASDWRS